jgi:hypothetical protein
MDIWKELPVETTENGVVTKWVAITERQNRANTRERERQACEIQELTEELKQLKVQLEKWLAGKIRIVQECDMQLVERHAGRQREIDAAQLVHDEEYSTSSDVT